MPPLSCGGFPFFSCVTTHELFHDANRDDREVRAGLCRCAALTRHGSRLTELVSYGPALYGRR
jgi:hypothetical protein